MTSITTNKNCVTKYILRLSAPISRYKRMRIDEKHPDSKIENSLRIDLGPQTKKLKPTMRKSSFSISRDEIAAFFALFDDSVIQDFLHIDVCYRLSDNYLLAMVLAYFKRARLTDAEYTRENFFIALYLANDMEEDEEDFKYEIFPWALGDDWRDSYPDLLNKKIDFWMRMSFRAAVSRKCCEEVMRIKPEHFVWKRERSPLHGGASRNYHKTPEEKEPFPRGPGRSPIPCRLCIRYNNSSGDHIFDGRKTSLDSGIHYTFVFLHSQELYYEVHAALCNLEKSCYSLNTMVCSYATDDGLLSGDECILHVSRTDSSPDDYFNVKNKANRKRTSTTNHERPPLADITNKHQHAVAKNSFQDIFVDVETDSSFDMNKLRATLV